MRRTLRAWNADIVHLAGPFVFGGQLGFRVGQSLGIPLAAHYQTNIERYARHFHLSFLAGVAQARLLSLHNRCRVNYAPTIGEAKALTAQGMRRVRVSGRGVDSVLFYPKRRSEQVRRALLQPGEHTILLYVGRLSAEKNIEHFAPTLARIPGAQVGIGWRRARVGRRWATLRGTARHLSGRTASVRSWPRSTPTSRGIFSPSPRSVKPSVRLFKRRWPPVRPYCVGAGGVFDLLCHGEEGYSIHQHARTIGSRLLKPWRKARYSRGPPGRAGKKRGSGSNLGVRFWRTSCLADYAAVLLGGQGGIPSLSARINLPGLQSKEGMHSAKERIA